MTTNSFIHLDYPRSHPGADRLERTVDAAGRVATRVRKNLSASRGLAAVLLAAMAATLLVVTDQLGEHREESLLQGPGVEGGHQHHQGTLPGHL